MAIRSLILSIGAKDESVQKTLEKIGALGAKTKDDLAKLGTGINTSQAEKQIDDLAAAIKKSQTNTENLTAAARQTSTGIELVGGVSRLTRTELDQVNKTLQTGLDAYRALGQEAPKDLQRVADAIVKQQQALSGAGKSIGGVTQETGLFGQATSLLSGQLLTLAGPAALGAAVKQALDYADTLVKMSDRTGIGVVALQRLEAIAKPSGNSIEELAGAINKFQKGLTEGTLDKPIERLGLSVAALKAQAPDEQFISIAKAIQQIQDPAEQARAAMELFGRSGGELLPSLKAKVDELADSTVKMSEESVKALDDFGDALGRWKTGSVNLIGEVLGKILSIPKAISDAQDRIDKLKPAKTPNFTQGSVVSALQSEDQPGGSTSEPVDDLAESFAALTAKIPSLTTQLKAVSGGFLPIGVAAVDVAEAVRKSNAEFGTLDEQLKKIGRNIELQKALEAIDKKIEAAQAPIVELTDKQKALAVEYKSFGLSAQEVGTKLGVSARSVDAFQVGLSIQKDTVAATAKEFRNLLAIVPDVASQETALTNVINGLTEDGLLPADDTLEKFNKHLSELQKVGQAPSGVMKEFRDEAEKAADKADRAATGIDELAKAFSQLSQVSGGAFGGIVQQIGNIVTSLDLATKSVKEFKKAKDEGDTSGELAAGASGLAAGIQATGSGSTLSRVAGGAATGAAIGSVIPGLGTAAGAVIGGTVGLLRGLFAGDPEKKINGIREAFVQAHGGLTALNEEAAKAGKTLNALLDAKNAQQYNAAINDLNSSFAKQDRISQGISALGVKSQTELRQAATDAEDVFNFMRTSGDYTADQVGKAFDAMRQAQADAGDAAAASELKAQTAATARVDELQKGLDDLKTQRDGLLASVQNEAPEEVMGVIEAANRGQIAALDDQIAQQQEKLNHEAETIADAIADKLGNIEIPPIQITARLHLDDSGLPDGIINNLAATGGLVTGDGIQHFARGGVVLPFLRRGTDTVPAMLTPGELILNKGQQQALNVALSGSLRPMVDVSAVQAELAELRREMARDRAMQPHTTARLVRAAVEDARKSA